MNPNSRLLIDTLEALPLLDGRYENLEWINFDPITGETRGCFSLVFKCRDRLENKDVALKFYDIHPSRMLDAYRLESFKREPAILTLLLGQKRCLQLVAGLKEFQLTIPGTSHTFPCPYFAIEWIDEELDQFFKRQHQFSAAEKLRLLNEIVLAIETLHHHEIHHRDIKPDNLRSYQQALRRIVVAIDLGTSARSDSAALKGEYKHTVGAPAYAAPEAFCGLAGHRTLAPYTDVYAIGCLLFQLFNKQLYVHELVTRNPSYDYFLNLMIHDIGRHKHLDNKVLAWKKSVKTFTTAVGRVSISAPGNSVPPAIRLILDNLLSLTTHIDFSKRTLDFEKIRQQLWSAIRVAENESAQRRRTELAKERRRLRLEKIKRRDAKLEDFLSTQRQFTC